ncbi:N-acetylmuramoyl-L-alanine amidase [Massilia sp. TS11]|uniref:N-acetylmuramoyl-L-alanine amidase n=1 Tax=Massilia sp. TS11 TaxID=2908003 RepID=UPI001EDA87DB|nr:N-acetylmuramoyl-L-alanine amidase [Massilia sp. TS11]MCG2585157.1 N-acetylmuramoyl-L-alanine amidase [Massilia sp. TS11]
MIRLLLTSLLLALLAGCAGPRIDSSSYSAKSQSSRVKFIIIHYTVSDRPQSIKILTEQEVSSHYLLTDEADPIIYRLVDESRQANHAGISFWKDYTRLNTSSIGIEIVNPGYKDTPEGRIYASFPEKQIDTLIGLVKDIAQRHNVPPENVLGHSDIAPQRKQDPGPQFPWKRLADAGLVIWPEPARVAAALPGFQAQLPDVAWFQKKLAQHGYSVPQTGTLDKPTQTVISAFQMKYRNTNIDGNPDAETAALLEALTGQQAKK